MSLHSDLTLNGSKLKLEAISPTTKQLNDGLLDLAKGRSSWFEVGAAKYRQMIKNGETTLPKPSFLEYAKSFSIPSREEGRNIPCRFILPESGARVNGVYMHIHGGGWTLMSEEDQDPFIKFISDEANLVVVSVGYRLAPEDPFPKGPEDCYDVAEWLVDKSKAKFGGQLKFVGGESAGGHLSSLTVLHLLKTRPQFALSGLVLSYGAYDLSLSPSVRNMPQPMPILTKVLMEKFLDAFLPNLTLEERRHASISPLYADLRSLKLPPALFMCGTEDILLEDTVMMSTRWHMAGAETMVRLIPGAPHGFTLFPAGQFEIVDEGLDVIRAYLKEKIGQ